MTVIKYLLIDLKKNYMAQKDGIYFKKNELIIYGTRTKTTTTTKQNSALNLIKIIARGFFLTQFVNLIFFVHFKLLFLLFYIFIIQYDFVRTRAVDRVIEFNCSDFEI